MNEINPGLWFAIGKKRTSLLRLQLPPAHVGDPFALVFGQALNMSLEESKPFSIAFLTALEQQLKTQADAQQWSFIVMPVAQRLHESRGTQLLHCRVKGANPRQDQSIAVVQILRVVHIDQMLPEPVKTSPN